MQHLRGDISQNSRITFVSRRSTARTFQRDGPGRAAAVEKKCSDMSFGNVLPPQPWDILGLTC